MGSVIGVPTTRVSDMFIRQRLMSQVQEDQLALLNLQTQLSTGYRIQLPSEDTGAANRIMTLQQLLERKGQIRTNLATNESFMTATDSVLSGISGTLADIRGVALSALDTTISDEQRDAVVVQIREAVEQLLDNANFAFRGRYLFTGTDTDTRPRPPQ